MFRHLRGLLAVIPLLLLTSCDGDKDKDNDKLKVGVCADYPPFEYYRDGVLSGFDVDIAKIVAEKLGKTAEFSDMAFSSILVEVKNGTIDAAVSSIGATDERKENYDFTTPYYKSGLSIIYKNDSPISDVDQLSNKKVACQLGSIPEKWLKAKNLKTEIVSIDNVNQAVESLKSGHVDYVLVDNAIAIEYCSTNNDLGSVVVVESIEGSEGFSVALKKGSPLKEQIDKILAELEANGELHNLKKKWKLVNE
ncbi:MAG: ABC transporter substrate-binding protein [Holosporales bacterium]|jgi:polar amino acid transport system substrate-binding protein|nr:ABC transporter substrate-binding protein [Holosporales bacterium]